MTTMVVKDNGARKLPFDRERLALSLEKKTEGLDISQETYEKFKESTFSQIEAQSEISFKEVESIATKNAIDYILDIKDLEGNMDFEKLKNVDFQYLASRILLNSIYKRASKNRAYNPDKKYGDFFGLLSTLGEKGLVDPLILRDYSKEEIELAGSYIVPSRDLIFTYAGMYNLSERYLIRDKDLSRSIYELPQERYLLMSMAIYRLEEKEVRMKHIKDLYDQTTLQKITMATPTLTNAGRPDGQFSSCFILTTEDDLRGIYDDNTDAATLSKNGGGIGVYMGKVRSSGADIRGNKGVGGGVVGWLKQLDNTAVSVDQLGVRKGAIATYLDIWHRDTPRFLELRLNTGSLEERAHNLFFGTCIPDVFWRQVRKRGDWFLFDPYEVKTVMGFSLEDFYDEKKLGDKEIPNEVDHAFTYRYFKCVDNPLLVLKSRVASIDIMKSIMRSQLETGLPYVFNRDTVNRENPNKHKGMIYSSNLCSEIAQNQSPSIVTDEQIDWETGEVKITKQIGDFVTCNLSSTVLNNAVDPVLFTKEGPGLGSQFIQDKKQSAMREFQKTISIQVRATDAVISVNRLPVPQAVYTNEMYRAIGLGQQGIAALLAKAGIPFDSHEATEFIEKLEKIKMLFTIDASADLAQEKGSYPYFEGSEWETGTWLERRLTGIEVEDSYLTKVMEKAKKGMRNGYLEAVAPTGSTSLLAGSTAAADTVFEVIFFDGKKDSRIPVVSPDLSIDTWFFYKPTMLMEFEGENDLGQMWAILHNEVRQKWTDQAISFNHYVPSQIKATSLLRLHLETWDRGIKTSYYTRSHDLKKVDDCLACSA